MNKIIFNEINKTLGIKAFKNGNIEAAVNHIEEYLQYLQDCIESNTNNEVFTVEKNETLAVYKKTLFVAGNNYFRRKNWAIALKCYQTLIKHNERHNIVYKHAAICLYKLQDYQTAIKLAEFYQKKEPEDNTTLMLLGDIYFQMDNKKYAQTAIDFYKKLIEKEPKLGAAYNAIGRIYSSVIEDSSDTMQNALFYFNKALEYDPNNPVVMRNIHLALMQKGDVKEAIEIYEDLYEKHHKHFSHDDYYNYAGFQISIGNFKKGWALLDHRFLKETEPTYYPKMNKPLWDGIKNIKNKTLLIESEQGFGDNIMFIRFAKYMKTFAKKVIARVPNELYELYKDSDLGIEVYGRKTPIPAIDFDYHMSVFSTPRVYKLSPQNIPDKQGYLKVNESRQKEYAESFIKTNKFKIGINLEGDKIAQRTKRDIPWVHLKKLCQNPNVQLYCFRKELDEHYFRNLDKDINIICLGETLNSFADTAAAIKNMDLMISTDNVILNLSGALGAKTLGLFNYIPEYRWYGVKEGKMIWYDSIQPIRAKRQNDWDSVIDKVVEEINKLVPYDKNETAKEIQTNSFGYETIKKQATYSAKTDYSVWVAEDNYEQQDVDNKKQSQGYENWNNNSEYKW